MTDEPILSKIPVLSHVATSFTSVTSITSVAVSVVGALSVTMTFNE